MCDPFCGVGGFLLELIVGNPHIMAEFAPRNGKIAPAIDIVGYDKGTDELEDERTIILAKANMLIYMSDLLARYQSTEFLRTFAINALNRIFTQLRSRPRYIRENRRCEVRSHSDGSPIRDEWLRQPETSHQ